MLRLVQASRGSLGLTLDVRPLVLHTVSMADGALQYLKGRQKQRLSFVYGLIPWAWCIMSGVSSPVMLPSVAYECVHAPLNILQGKITDMFMHDLKHNRDSKD